MIYPWLSIFDLQILYSNIRKPLECTEESSNDYTIIVPVFKDPSYLQNYEYLKQHKDKIVIASLRRQNPKMDAFIVKLMSEGFIVNAELDNEQQNVATEYYSLMKRTIETEVYDSLRQLSVRSVRTKYTVFLDGDSVPDGNIGRAIAVMEREGLDLASVRIIPSSEERLIEKMQAIEYKIAMRGRHFRPWLTSGACLIGRTTALRDIMNTHSLYFSGGDAEIGIIAKEMKQKIGYINFTVLTRIPNTFSSWFKQRVSWYGGTFRLFIVNFNKHLKSPLLLAYVLLFGFALLPFKLLEILQDWIILPLVLLLYVPITFANWQVRNRYMLLFPLYSAFQCLVIPCLGFVKYLHSLAKYKKVGRIKVRKLVAHASAQEETAAVMTLPLTEEGQATNKKDLSISRRIVYQDLKLTNYIKFGSRMNKRQSGTMAQVETLPQSMAGTKTIVLKPRLDNSHIRLIGEKIKPSLFTRFGFKSKPSDIQLLASETYFEPYFIIAGKYVLDYCRKHAFDVAVEETTTKIYVAGQEFRSEKSASKKTKKILKMTGEEHIHHERQAYYILDRMKREVPSEKLPIAPFQTQTKRFQLNSNFRSIHIPDEMQIEFLKTKIAQRPKDVAEIIREVFDITDRTIAYYPMYQLTFENEKNRKDATVTINGVTGEIILNGTKRLAVKTIVGGPDQGTGIRATQATLCEMSQSEPILNVNQPETTNTARTAPKEEAIQPTRPKTEETMILGFPARISGEVVTVGDNVTAMVGDIEVPSGTSVNKTPVAKGTLRIGDNCKVRGRLKALKGITLGANTIVDGDVIAGDNVLVGPGVLITGRLQAGGYIRVGKRATIKQGLGPDPAVETANDIQFEVDIGNTVALGAHEIRKAKSTESHR